MQLSLSSCMFSPSANERPYGESACRKLLHERIKRAPYVVIETNARSRAPTPVIRPGPDGRSKAGSAQGEREADSGESWWRPFQAKRGNADAMLRIPNSLWRSIFKAAPPSAPGPPPRFGRSAPFLLARRRRLNRRTSRLRQHPLEVGAAGCARRRLVALDADFMFAPGKRSGANCERRRHDAERGARRRESHWLAGEELGQAFKGAAFPFLEVFGQVADSEVVALLAFVAVGAFSVAAACVAANRHRALAAHVAHTFP